MDFGEKLKALRTERGLTQEQLAARLYVSRTAVSKWETGGGSPNLDSLQAVARLFDVSVDDLLVYCFRHFSRSGRALYLPRILFSPLLAQWPRSLPSFSNMG